MNLLTRYCDQILLRNEGRVHHEHINFSILPFWKWRVLRHFDQLSVSHKSLDVYCQDAISNEASVGLITIFVHNFSIANQFSAVRIHQKRSFPLCQAQNCHCHWRALIRVLKKPINDFSSSLQTFSINSQSIDHNSLSSLFSFKVHTKQISQVLKRPYIYLFCKFGLNSEKKSNLLGNRSCINFYQRIYFLPFRATYPIKTALRIGEHGILILATTLDTAVDGATSK